MSFLAKNTQFAERHGFRHHSTPSTPDGFVLWDKGVYRIVRDLAWRIILGKQPGDKGWAQDGQRVDETIDAHTLYGCAHPLLLMNV